MIFMKKQMINKMNIYYAIWADVINYERIKNGGATHWKIFTFSYMSILLSLNIATLYTIIQLLFGFDITIIVEQFLSAIQSKLLRDFAWTIFTLFIPGMGVTYYFIFYKKKYEIILDKYKFWNGKLLLIYFFLTVFLMFGSSLLNKFY